MLSRLTNIIKGNWGVILSFLLLTWAILPLLHPGFFSMHDNEQIGRLFDMDQTIKAGQFPVRIIPNLGFGYGYPLFNFYPPFVYYFSEIFKLIGFGYIDSIKIMIGFGFFFSFAFMYLFAKEYFGRLAGILAAVAYTYAPYHSVDVYVRGALPEFWSFVFIPAVFWSLVCLQKTNKVIYLVLSSFFGAMLILAHDLIAIMVLLFIALYFLFLLYQSKNRKTFFSLALISGILGLGLSAFFWLPAILEKQYTAVNLLTVELANYAQHFVCARQFIFSKWGYSGSVPGCFDGLSFSVGIPQLILVLLPGLLLILNFRRVKKYMVIILFYFFLATSLFMQTIHSKFIWDAVKSFWYIQFPWRFLLITDFVMSFLIGSIFYFKFDRRIKIGILFIGVFSIIFLNKGFFKPQTYYQNKVDNDYTNTSFIRWDTSKLAAEYVPTGVKMKKTEFGNTAIDITQNQIATQSYKVLSGDMNVELLSDKPQIKKFKVDAMSSGLFQAQTFSFPGWHVLLDNKEIRYQDNNQLRLITFPLTRGQHFVKLVFEDTAVRKLSNMLSILSFVCLIILLFSQNRLKSIIHD